MRGALCGIVAALALSIQPASGTDLLLHGKVVLEDGSAPGHAVSIERQCHGAETTVLISTTNRKGEYTWRVTVNSFGVESLGSGFGVMGDVCFLKATLSGYVSTTIDLTDRKWSSDPTLPALVLVPRGSNSSLNIFVDTGAPAGVSKTWSQAAKAAQAKNWPEAERLLRAIVESAPQFSQGWNALGLMCQNQRKTAEARQAYQRLLRPTQNYSHPICCSRERICKQRIGRERCEWRMRLSKRIRSGFIRRSISTKQRDSTI